MMDDLIHLSPNPWKATLRNIFAARVAKGDANATAWSFRQSGVVEINYGFTNAAMIYAALFMQYFDAISTIASEVDLSMEDSEVLGWILAEIDQGVSEPILLAESSRELWRREGAIFVGHPSLADVPRRRLDSYQLAAAATEEFALAHEICHHMLGHTEKTFKHAGEIEKTVISWIRRAGSYDLWSGLNASQKEEVQADVAAFLLMSGELNGTFNRGLTYKAVSGSMLALTALAHISEHWFSDDQQESHPDFLDRFSVVSGIIVGLSTGLPRGGKGDHPLGFLLQFRGFISMVLQTWISKHDNSVNLPTFLNTFSWLLDEGADIDNLLDEA
ncbi:hypothetical protein [Streptomyces chartreusis]|uniref:hypothetical protein n=1 Tax=Streptomyces chartreusis TaxID=1969 RepID=UPI0033C58B92